MKKSTVSSFVALLAGLFFPVFEGQTQTPFSCSSDVYQLVGSNATLTSVLYRYNINTGNRTKMADVAATANAIGYNQIDNMIWGYADKATVGSVIRISADGSHTLFPIPNLPVDNSIITGDITSDGYLIMYGNSDRFYTVDVNPNRPDTYLKLVNPTNGFLAQINNNSGLTMLFEAPLTEETTSVADWAYNPNDGKFYGINAGVAAIPAELRQNILQFDPTTRTIKTLGRATGANIRVDDTGSFGAAFFDASGYLYAFGNTSAKYYRIDLSTTNMTTTSLGTSTPTNYNDGASCTRSIVTSLSLSGLVYLDGNGTTNNTVDGVLTSTLGTAPLYVNLINASGRVEAVSTITNGTYSFVVSPNTTYTIQLSSTAGVVNQTPPTTTIPTGFFHVGENIGTGSGNDGTSGALSDGRLSINVGTENVEYANFAVNTAPIAVNGVDPTVYPNPKSTNRVNVLSTLFNGSDAEDGTYGSNLAGRRITLSPGTGANLYYDGQLIENTSTFSTSNFDPTLVSVDPISEDATTITFTYAVADNAGFLSNQATITMQFDNSLPVTVITFQGSLDNDQRVRLSWSTSEEVNASHFEIERSKDGREWRSIGTVNTIGKNAGISRYDFNDESLLTGLTYYRLKMVDLDGTFEYSNLISLEKGKSTASLIAYPNPTSDYLFLEGIQASEITNVSIIGFNGKQAITMNNWPVNGINIQSLTEGVYIIRIKLKDNSIQTQKVLIKR